MSNHDEPDTTTIDIEYTDGAPLAPDDARVGMARAVQAARAVLERLDATNAERPSPCAEWTALDVARHIVAVFRRASVAPSGADLSALPVVADVELSDIVTAARDAAIATHVAWTDADTLDAIIEAPFGTMPGAALLGVWTGETLVHTWDLAVSIGVELDWPEPDTTRSLELAMAFLPESGRPAAVPFDDAVVLSEDQVPIDRLAGWMGRDVPAWR